MKRLLLFCLICVATLDTHAATGNPPQPDQAFSAVLWTTTTLHSPAGKTFTFMRRTVYSRDALGRVRREIYRPTKGLQHDTTAPLERVLTGSTSPAELPHLQSSKETLQHEVDLGMLRFSGTPAAGKRQTFQDASGRVTHMQETWFSPTLGLTVHAESRNERGDSVVSDLSEVHLGEPIPRTVELAPVVSPAIPLLILYRGLFTHVAHMETERLTNDPNRHVNMAEIEDHVRSKIEFSNSQWQVLIDTSMRVEQYTREKSKEARTFADQDRAARRENPLSANTPSNGRATLHGMQLELNTHIQAEIDGLAAKVGSDAADRIRAYLQGTFAASISAMPVKTVLQSQRERGQSR